MMQTVICIPARFVSLEDAKQMIEIFMSTAFRRWAPPDQGL
jgi:ribose 5-phosphate isomerase RpiB